VADSALDEELRSALKDRETRHLLRAEPAEPSGIDFTSNDYLGLARHPRLVEAMCAAAQEYGAGSRASRLLGGSAAVARTAEKAANAWIGTEEALLFQTGYQANLGLIGSLVGRGDTIVSDRLSHASLIDAARLSRATVKIFDHNDAAHAEELLASSQGSGRRILVTEGIFSMDGDLAPLAALARVCERQDAWLVIDEAHSAGILGRAGRGAWAAAAEQQPLPERLAARVFPCGKALGLGGAFVVGSSALRDTLLNGARSLIYSTAPPPAQCAGLSAAIALVQGTEGDAARTKLRANAKHLASALDVTPPTAAILPMLLGSSEQALETAARLTAAGLDVRALRPPTVPAGSSRLRIVLRADHTTAELDSLASALHKEQLKPSSAPVARPRPFLVFGTDTDVGKTVVAAACVQAASQYRPTRYWKPVQTGPDSDTQEVADLAVNTDYAEEQPGVEFPLPASPHEAAAAAGSHVDIEHLNQRLAAALRPGETLIVEPAGGLLVPLTDELLTLDWIAAARPRCLLVARSGLGTLNHTLLSLEALAARGLRPEALVLVGKPHPSNRATLATHVERVFELPILTPLRAETLSQWIHEQAFAELFQA
jgi:8-amino-7-oxononanoate synthase